GATARRAVGAAGAGPDEAGPGGPQPAPAGPSPRRHATGGPVAPAGGAADGECVAAGVLAPAGPAPAAGAARRARGAGRRRARRKPVPAGVTEVRRPPLGRAARRAAHQDRPGHAGQVRRRLRPHDQAVLRAAGRHEAAVTHTRPTHTNPTPKRGQIDALGGDRRPSLARRACIGGSAITKGLPMRYLVAIPVLLAVTLPLAAQDPKTTEKKPEDVAIDKALAFLASTQDKADGSWKSNNTKNAAVTSLAVMAFLSAGHVPGEGKYGEVVEKGVRYVLTQQQANGLLAG